MSYLQQSFSVKFEYNVYFTTALFNRTNPLFSDFLDKYGSSAAERKILFVVDRGVYNGHPHLLHQIREYFEEYSTVRLVPKILIMPGGEVVKNDLTYFKQVLNGINTEGIDRHSFIAAIGGGALLDLVGYAAAVAHRGVKHIRVPTTVLSQNDSGVGVKNGINYFGKKNFLGSFVPPAAVFNDAAFLPSLSHRDWRSGTSEAVKVALIKDLAFFEWLEQNVEAIASRDLPAMVYLIRRCAELHLEHIAGGDAFESGSSRPLDFGHWSAHKMEQLSGFEILHGEAVALGIALDTVYSHLKGFISRNDMQRVIRLLKSLGFDIIHPLLKIDAGDSPVLAGLQEFREHLGGRLTIMLLASIGKGKEVNEMDAVLLENAVELLHEL